MTNTNTNKGAELARATLDAVNSFDTSLRREFAEGILNGHRTLQQSTMGLFLRLVTHWADAYEKGRYDDRNQATCALAHRMVAELGEDFFLPMI